MSEYGFSMCNFSMLTEHLLVLFKCYILGGRLRAPPEYELYDLIPTFRPEAKTNRRALQSKFKSWARRMDVRNGKLVLNSNGKTIISKEKSKDLILSLHSKDHLPVDQIVMQIRRNYTWTSKNFGVDREVVSMIIIKHCPRAECRVEIKKDLTRRTYSNILFPGLMVPSFPHPMLPSTPSMFLPWGPSSTSPLYPTQRSTALARSKFKWMRPDNVVKKHVLPTRTTGKTEDSEDHNTNRKNLRLCKKVKNIHEFKAVLEGSNANPSHYPAVLSSPKTQFFGLLGLAPTKVCASSAIHRFRKEMSRRPEQRLNRLKKQRAEMFCRKVLRDRNKLAKTKPFSQEHGSKKNKAKKTASFMMPPKKIKKEETYIKQEPEENKEAVKKKPYSTRQAAPELIDLASSGDENINSVCYSSTALRSTKLLPSVNCQAPGTVRPILQRLRADRSAIGDRPLPRLTIQTSRPLSSTYSFVQPRAIQPKATPQPNSSFRLILAKQMPDGRYVVVNSHPVAKSVLINSQGQQQFSVPKVAIPPLGKDAVVTESKEKVSGSDVKRDVSWEMKRVLDWMRKTRSLVKPSLHKGTEKALQKLTAHLNTGLYLVRDTRKAVLKIENSHQGKEDDVQIKTESTIEEGFAV